MNATAAKPALDFEEIRQVPLTAILEKLGLMSGLRRVGKHALSGSCPLCGCKSRKAFSISLNRTPQLWRCFDPGHDRGGDALAFIAEHERVDIKEAAALIAGWFAIAGRQVPQNQRVKIRRTTVTESNPNRPTHKVYSASKREGQKDFLTRIGSAWPFQMKDGKSGLNIQLTALPVGDRLVCFEYDEEAEAEEPAAEKKGNGRKK